jgi:hypothetical protein
MHVSFRVIVIVSRSVCFKHVVAVRVVKLLTPQMWRTRGTIDRAVQVILVQCASYQVYYPFLNPQLHCHLYHQKTKLLKPMLNHFSLSKRHQRSVNRTKPNCCITHVLLSFMEDCFYSLKFIMIIPNQSLLYRKKTQHFITKISKQSQSVVQLVPIYRKYSVYGKREACFMYKCTCSTHWDLKISVRFRVSESSRSVCHDFRGPCLN